MKFHIAILLSLATSAGAASLRGSQASPSICAEPSLLAGPGAFSYLNTPTSLAVNPQNSKELWVVNYATDSISVLNLEAAPQSDLQYFTSSSGRWLQDAFAEHFMERAIDIAFSRDLNTTTFATIGESENGVRGMTFVSSPERNTNFKGSNFTGPTLWDSQTFARIRQTKPYLGDWLAPGGGRDPNNPVPPCSATVVDTQVCHSEGSHNDMLHDSPLGMGMAHFKKNVYAIVDGSGHRDGGKGHLALYDFNKDHRDGNTYHADGRVQRYLDVELTRQPGVLSGMAFNNSDLYIADTGAGRVVRVAVESDSAVTYPWLDSYYPWLEGVKEQTGLGTILTFDDADSKNKTGSEPSGTEIDSWISRNQQDGGKYSENQVHTIELGVAGGFNGTFIAPMEPLAEYSAVLGATQETLNLPFDRKSGVEPMPSGITLHSSGGLVVADHATGTIYLFAERPTKQKEESTWEEKGRIETGAAGSLMGIEEAPEGGGMFYADSKKHAVFIGHFCLSSK